MSLFIHNVIAKPSTACQVTGLCPQQSFFLIDLYPYLGLNNINLIATAFKPHSFYDHWKTLALNVEDEKRRKSGSTGKETLFLESSNLPKKQNWTILLLQNKMAFSSCFLLLCRLLRCLTFFQRVKCSSVYDSLSQRWFVLLSFYWLQS